MMLIHEDVVCRGTIERGYAMRIGVDYGDDTPEEMFDITGKGIRWVCVLRKHNAFQPLKNDRFLHFKVSYLATKLI